MTLHKDNVELDQKQRVFIEKLYDKNYDRLLEYALIFLNEADAEEAVQNLFLDACRPGKIDKLLEHPRPEAWLGQGIKFSINKIKRSKQQLAKLVQNVSQYAESGDELTKNIDAIPDVRPLDIDVNTLYEDLALHKDFQLVKRYAVDGKSAWEIAQEDNVSLPTCRKRLVRAKERLRKIMKSEKKF